MSKIKPCPFCGGEAEIIGYDESCFDANKGFAYYVQCMKCLASSHANSRREDAVKKWSDRSVKPAHSDNSKPIPKPFYPCKYCADEYSWPADDLYWIESVKSWVCDNCADYHHENEELGITLAEEAKKQGVK